MINKKKRNFLFTIPKIFLGFFSCTIFFNSPQKKQKFVNYNNWILKEEDLKN